ncbi:MAG: hypothetical protein GY906_10165 [bacterium]|nr:hypothetical protein [bacterium]
MSGWLPVAILTGSAAIVTFLYWWIWHPPTGYDSTSLTEHLNAISGRRYAVPPPVPVGQVVRDLNQAANVIDND